MLNIDDIASRLRTDNIAYDKHADKVKTRSRVPLIDQDIECNCRVCRYIGPAIVAAVAAAALAFAIKISMMI